MQAFIRSLDDEEIASQVNDLFAFMEEYKRLLIEEQNIRRHSLNQNNFDVPTLNHGNSPIIKDSEAVPEDVNVDVSLNYNVLNAIHGKVAGFSEDELLEKMKELDEILAREIATMPQQAFEEYRAAREACEIRYFEDYQCEPLRCKQCGAYLLPTQKFCGKCGSSLKDS